MSYLPKYTITIWFLGFYAHTFMLKEKWREPQYKARGFVCLNCGFLGHYLPESELNELQASLRGDG
jgi:hypothetical protein